MKKILIFTGLLALFFTACKKDEVKNVFYAAPEQRVADTLNYIRTELTSAPYGWKAGFSTGLKGGFGFYLDFDEQQMVEMLSDYSGATGNTVKKSTYRIKAAGLPSLIFDTYNYISLMQDPVPGVAGGTAGQGYRSDIEFNYQGHRGDSLFFTGKKYQYPFTLVKATQQEQQAYLANGLTNNKTSFINTYNLNYVFSYLSGNSESNLAIEVDYDAKVVKFTYVTPGGEVLKSTTSPFFYTTSDLSLVRGYYVPYNGKLIKALRASDNQVLAVFTDDSTQELDTQGSPLYNFDLVFDYNKTFKSLVWDGTLIPGVTANVQVFNSVNNLFNTSGRTINTMYFRFNNSTTAIFYIGYVANSSGSAFVASATYAYRREGNKLWLKRTGIDGGNNWNTRATQVAPVNNLFGTGEEREFVLDWVSSSSNAVKFPIGAIKSVSNLNNMLHGKLGE